MTTQYNALSKGKLSQVEIKQQIAEHLNAPFAAQRVLTEAEQKPFQDIAIAYGMSGDIKVLLGEVKNFACGDAV